MFLNSLNMIACISHNTHLWKKPQGQWVWHYAFKRNFFLDKESLWLANWPVFISVQNRRGLIKRHSAQNHIIKAHHAWPGARGDLQWQLYLRLLAGKQPGSPLSLQTRPSVMEVSPWTLGLSKSILPIDHRMAGDHQIAGDHRIAGIIE